MSRIPAKHRKKFVHRKTTPVANSNPLGDCLKSVLAENEKLVVLASGLATHTVPTPENQLAVLVQEVAESFPARFYGMGELLENLIPTAAKLWAEEGLRPLVVMGSTDLARGYASLSAACVAQLPIIFILAAGPGVGQTWQTEDANDLAVLRTLPPLYIGAPGDQTELKQQLTVALADESRPIALRYYPLPGSHPRSLSRINLAPAMGIGKAQMLREGKELAIIALGPAVATALDVAERLAQRGYEAAVVNARWARPLDEPLISAIANHFPRLVTLEDGGLTGGFGAEVLEFLERSGLYNTKARRYSLNIGRKIELEQLAAEIGSFVERLNQAEGLKFGSLNRLPVGL